MDDLYIATAEKIAHYLQDGTRGMIITPSVGTQGTGISSIDLSSDGSSILAVAAVFGGSIGSYSTVDGTEEWRLDGHFSFDVEDAYIKTLSDGGFVVVASEQGFSTTQEVVRFASDNSVVWSYTPPEDTPARYLAVTDSIVAFGVANWPYVRYLNKGDGSFILDISPTDSLTGVAADDEGNVIVSTEGGLFKFDSAGTELWSNTSRFFGLAAAGAGNLFANSRGTGAGFHGIDPDNGSILWSYTTIVEFQQGVGVDTAGNAYAVDNQGNGVDTASALFKLNPDGSEAWTDTLEWVTYDVARDISVEAVAATSPASLPPKFWTDLVGTREIRKT